MLCMPASRPHACPERSPPCTSSQMADRLQMASTSSMPLSNTATWAPPPAETHGVNSLGALGEHVSIGAALSSLPDDELHASSFSPE